MGSEMCIRDRCDTEHSNVNCHRVAATKVGSGRHLDHHFMVESRVGEIVNQQALNKMLELDFSERTENKEQEYSPEDTKCVKIVSQGICHTEDHHYEIPLPFRADSQWFPDNREQVLPRTLWLRKKLIKNDKFYKDYVNLMSSIIAKGFARKVPSHLIPAKTGQV